MAQHFRHSSKSRGLSSKHIARLTEEEAWQMLVTIRWGSNGTQCCPKCGTVRKHHFIKSRKQWRCAEKECGHTFSVTSSSKLAYHKKELRDILFAVARFTNSVKGVSAVEESHDNDCEHKSNFVFNHKLREALWEKRDLTPLKGEVEVDACYTHYYVRPKNKRKNRVDRRIRFNLNPNKRATLVMRERGIPGQGAKRSIVCVIKDENARDVGAIIRKYVAPGSTIYSDENTAYTALNDVYCVKQVNHAEEYSADDGTNENQAESFFSRLRRLFNGNIHHCAPKYLIYYDNEIAWREDNRRQSSLWLFNDLLKKCLTTGQSKNWSKYWQGNHLMRDTLFSAR